MSKLSLKPGAVPNVYASIVIWLGKHFSESRVNRVEFPVAGRTSVGEGDDSTLKGVRFPVVGTLKGRGRNAKFIVWPDPTVVRDHLEDNICDLDDEH